MVWGYRREYQSKKRPKKSKLCGESSKTRDLLKDSFVPGRTHLLSSHGDVAKAFYTGHYSTVDVLSPHIRWHQKISVGNRRYPLGPEVILSLLNKSETSFSFFSSESICVRIYPSKNDFLLGGEGFALLSSYIPLHTWCDLFLFCGSNPHLFELHHHDLVRIDGEETGRLSVFRTVDTPLET